MAGFVYMVRDDGTATGDNGRYTDGEITTIGADAFDNAGSTGGGTNNDWDARGLGAAANYFYSDIQDAIDTPTSSFAAGDRILVSNAHDFTKAAATHTIATGLSSGVLGEIISVSDSDISTYAAGASEGTQDTYNFYFAGSGVFKGITFVIGNQSIWGNSGSQHMYYDCTLDHIGSSPILLPNGDGVHVELHNTIVKNSHATSIAMRWQLQFGSTLKMYGGTYENIASTMSRFLKGSTAYGGCALLVDGVDLSKINSAIWMDGGGDRTNDDAMEFVVKNCKTRSMGNGFVKENCDSINQRFTATNCGSTSAEAEYQFYIQAFGGEVEDDTSIWRAESIAFPSDMRVSAKITTTGNVCEGAPFTFELPARWATLSTTDTIRIYLASTTALTKELTWATLIYADGTNNHDANYLTSKPTNWLSSGTALETDSTSSWRDGTQPTGDALAGGYNFYYIDLDTSGDAGADSAPLITIHCGEAAATEIFIDTTVDVV